MNPLSVATRGFLCKNVPESIATRGFFCGDSVVIVEIPQPRLNRFAEDTKLPIKKFDNRLFIDDDEVLTILKIFIQCQDRALRS